MSLAYFNKKLRRQSKQPAGQAAEAEAEAEPATATPSPAPAVSTPSEEPAASPVLDDEDQRFLERLAAIAAEPEGTPPQLPIRPGKDAQDALVDGADQIPLPMSPPEVITEESDKDTPRRKKSVMSYFALAQQRFKRNASKDADPESAKKGKEKEKEKEKEKAKEKASAKDRAKAADDLHAAAEAANISEQEEVNKENQDLTEILDRLNLSAVNNRVFSFSKESEDLLNRFKLVLKDLVNGVPTAYNDLEKLLTDSETQLKNMYGSLPPFLQNLVKSLPTKITAAFGPELMAASAEKPGFDAKAAGATAGKASKKAKASIPSLKSLVSAEGAVATMLRSILSFLKMRFPALMTGTNVLLSLAVFLLLFVFWYCHKRGRETRLERDAQLTAEGSDPAFASSASSFTDNDDCGDSLLNSTAKGNSRDTDRAEESSPPVIISDKAAPDADNAELQDLPSVKDLPEPGSIPLPETPAKEEPLKVPEK